MTIDQQNNNDASEAEDEDLAMLKVVAERSKFQAEQAKWDAGRAVMAEKKENQNNCNEKPMVTQDIALPLKQQEEQEQDVQDSGIDYTARTDGRSRRDDDMELMKLVEARATRPVVQNNEETVTTSKDVKKDDSKLDLPSKPKTIVKKGSSGNLMDVSTADGEAHEMVVALTDLRRTETVAPSLPPGAYSATPGEGLRRTQDASKCFHLHGNNAHSSALTHDTVSVDSNERHHDDNRHDEEQAHPAGIVTSPDGEDLSSSHQEVPIAKEVSENKPNLELESAEPVDMDAARKKQVARKKQKNFLVAAAVVLVATALVVGLVVGLQSNGNADGKTEVVAIPTTVSQTSAPSMAPSSAPTEILDDFILTLPESTQASLLDGITPQYQALEWLKEHQNVTFMPDWRKTQLFALACFFFAMEGPNWRPGISQRWMDDEKDECYWYSGEFGYFNESQYYQYITYDVDPCNNVTGKFQHLVLSFLELEGFKPFIPPEIALLTDLEILALQFNDINASLAEFLPSELYRMSSLSILNLHTNDFHGSLPSQLGLLGNLTSLSVATCAMTGSIPSEIGLLTNVFELYLQKNSLSHTVPTEMGMMSSLERFYIWRNALIGHVPSELGLLSNDLKTIELFANYLTGAIPSELGLLTTLTDLALDANMLTGTLSSHFGAMSGLKGFFVHYNDISGSLPSEIGNWVNITHMGFQENNHDGPLPSELGLLSNANSIFLQDNIFSGNVPLQLLQLPQLELLDLSKNLLLSGFIPLDTLPSTLKHLNISGTSLSGTVPDRLCIANESCSVGFFWDPSPCTLGFDCSEMMCGCNCSCASSGVRL